MPLRTATNKPCVFRSHCSDHFQQPTWKTTRMVYPQTEGFIWSFHSNFITKGKLKKNLKTILYRGSSLMSRLSWWDHLTTTSWLYTCPKGRRNCSQMIFEDISTVLRSRARQCRGNLLMLCIEETTKKSVSIWWDP